MCLLVFKKESVHAEQFLYVKHALQYVHGHAEPYKNLTLLHSERPKLYTILAFLSAIGLIIHGGTAMTILMRVTTYVKKKREKKNLKWLPL